jgi:hypothetical protein
MSGMTDHSVLANHKTVRSLPLTAKMGVARQRVATAVRRLVWNALLLMLELLCRPARPSMRDECTDVLCIYIYIYIRVYGCLWIEAYHGVSTNV